MGDLNVLFLEDGAQPAATAASWLAAILARARKSLDLAIFDFHLDGEAESILMGALHERVRAGVRLRIVFHEGYAPPPREVVGDPAWPNQTGAFLSAHGLHARPVGDAYGAHLMHHKYLVVDAWTPRARVWTGSANLTVSAFTRQENNLLDI